MSRLRIAIVMRRLLGPVSTRLGIRFFDLFYGERLIDEVPPAVHPPIPLFARAATPEDLHRILGRLDSEMAKQVRYAMQRGSLCLLAESAGEIAGFIWANLKWVDLMDGSLCPLPNGGACIHTTYVFPELRGKKVFRFLDRTLHETLRARGLRFTCRLIDRANTPALTGVQRGGIRYRWAPILKLPGLAPFFLRPRPPALRPRREARPG